MVTTTNQELFLQHPPMYLDNGECVADSWSSHASTAIPAVHQKLNVYTVGEAANMLHHTVPKSAIYRLINDGKLHAKRVGKQFLIPKQSLEEFLLCREEAERTFQEYLNNKLTGLPIPVDPNQITIGEILCRYAEDKGRKQKSPERTAYAIQALAPFWGGLSPNDITEQKCFSYQQSRDVMASNVRRELGVLNAALNHAGKAFRLPNLPKAELPPKSEPLNRWLTRDEVAQLRQHALPHLDRFIILSLFTGRRKKAILDLRWERSPQNGWIDLDMGMIHFKGCAETESSKRRGSITMPGSLLKLAKEWHKDGQKSVIHYNDKPVSDVDTSFDRVCKLCGLNRRCPPHPEAHSGNLGLSRGYDGRGCI